MARLLFGLLALIAIATPLRGSPPSAYHGAIHRRISYPAGHILRHAHNGHPKIQKRNPNKQKRCSGKGGKVKALEVASTTTTSVPALDPTPDPTPAATVAETSADGNGNAQNTPTQQPSADPSPQPEPQPQTQVETKPVEQPTKETSKVVQPTTKEPEPVETPVAQPDPQPQNSGTGSDGLTAAQQQRFIDLHNQVRSQHGASPVTWSDQLASAAKSWANGCVFQHSHGSLGPYGENLAAGSSNTYDVGDAMKAWSDEVSEYDPSNPQPSHYTQIVWKGTQQIGCGLATGCTGIFGGGGTARYFVCEYFPAGNVIGQFASNVQ
ncbi:hypothetical protein FRB99_006642 [Tulasnella sp. 403]|nr:hypothetical protein FRB99_006642 [Tulasnella sp. 403]